MCGIDVGNQYRVADFVEATLGRIHGVVGSRVLSSLGEQLLYGCNRFTKYFCDLLLPISRSGSCFRDTQNFCIVLQQLLKNYSPWGKPGGGAPCAATLRKKNVPLEPLELSKCHDFGQGWTSDSTIERLHGRNVNPLPVTDMNKFFDDRPEGVATGMQLAKSYSKNPYNEEVQVYELTGGVELVPLLTTRRYCSRSKGARHIATDATRPGCTIDSLRTLEVGNREYIAELCDQMRRKEEKALEERRMEQESCRRHFDTWRKLWGRPGHGAPIDHAHRNNLYNILYRPAIY
ncbi:uncharacterized protein LOC107995336 isoform X3 [Apis cerana]|uniref:uncharacterized protein LOC107995336 isoform X3 n=1 Tax=Apis cerana TaxID=7461 RepID=UPI002B23D7FF|nr:uncharacterized protein LOC107995336 isoform X3 [Apis cerana]